MVHTRPECGKKHKKPPTCGKPLRDAFELVKNNYPPDEVMWARARRYDNYLNHHFKEHFLPKQVWRCSGCGHLREWVHGDAFRYSRPKTLQNVRAMPAYRKVGTDEEVTARLAEAPTGPACQACGMLNMVSAERDSR